MRLALLIALPCALSFALLVGCPTSSVDSPEPTPAAPAFPSLMVTPAHQDQILSRLDREPYLTVLADVRATAAEPYEADDLEAWDHGINGRNAERAQAHAFLAWLFEDPDEAAAAVDGFATLGAHWDTNTVWDINIRMPHTLMGFVNALDLLRGTPWLPPADAEALCRTLLSITGQFYDQFLLNEGVRGLVMGPSQNNHPIRTAAAIGYVALAFPREARAQEWADWAFSELDYLWGPEGRYVQADGVVSEGPFYFGFAWGVSTALFIAVDNLGGVPFDLRRDCRNRNDIDPWAPIDCTDGEPFTFSNPLRSESFQSTAEWSLAIALPWGSRPPIADSYENPFNGGALLSSFGADGRFLWDWQENRDRPLELHHGADLAAHHLAYVDDTVLPTPPATTHRLFTAGGEAVLRSSWAQDALWMLLLGEAGPARKTLHDHVDGTSFSLAAFGESLLLDPGYYKPVDLDNARTAHSRSHNLVLIDGIAAPNKGLLTNFGDADAAITGFVERDAGNAAAQATQAYQDSVVTRTLVMVQARFGVVFDRITTSVPEAREHRFRLHGHAGFESGGLFALSAAGAGWERPNGVGIDVFVGSPDGALGFEEPPFVANQAPHVHQFGIDRSVGHHAVMDAVRVGVEPDFVAILAPYAEAEERLVVVPAGTGFVVTLEGAAYEVTFDGEVGRILGAGLNFVVDADGLRYP